MTKTLLPFFTLRGLPAEKAAPRKRHPLPLFTPEYAHGVPVFILRFFEDLFSRLSSSYVFIFENYQDIPEKSPLHQVICDGIAVAPNHVHIIFYKPEKSSSPLHTSFRAKSMCRIISFEQISFTLTETKKLVALSIGDLKNAPKICKDI